jgi:hypothetical protein
VRSRSPSSTISPRPTPTSRPCSRRTVPLPRTALSGRACELQQLSEWVRAGDGSFVTLVGPGGAGKTRLALELCVQGGSDFDGDVHFVDLREIHDPARVVSEIAAVLGVAEDPGQDPLDRVVTLLRHGARLLVLDNIEQAVEAAPTVAALAARCPQLGVVVTSRRRLNVRAERLLVVKPLDFSPAVALFCERAAAVTDRDLTSDAERARIEEICRRLECARGTRGRRRGAVRVAPRASPQPPGVHSTHARPTRRSTPTERRRGAPRRGERQRPGRRIRPNEQTAARAGQGQGHRPGGHLPRVCRRQELARRSRRRGGAERRAFLRRELADAVRWADRSLELAVRASDVLAAAGGDLVGLFTASAAQRHRDVAASPASSARPKGY